MKRDFETAESSMPDTAAVAEYATISVESGPEVSDQHRTQVSAWVELHSDYLYRYSYRYFRSREICEDLVQDTFLAAVKSTFEDRSSARTFLTSILRHKIIDRMRSQGRAAKFEATLETEDRHTASLFDANEHWTTEAGPIRWGSSADDLVQQKQFVQAVQGCLGKMPAKFSQIFLLREVEGLSRSELCEQLSLTSSNVGVILHRARLLLQSCLQTNWFRTSGAGTQ